MKKITCLLLFAAALLSGANRAAAQSFTLLHTFTAVNNFTNSDGSYPQSQLALSGSTLYGTAQSGGTNGVGVVFAISASGTNYTLLHQFAALTGVGTNLDGADPVSGLTLAGGTLYGTALSGGTNDCGTVFSVNTNGTGFTTLHNFTLPSGFGSTVGTNTDGAQPQAGLVLGGNTLYGTTLYGGKNGYGTVFALPTGGTNFTALHYFNSAANTNSAGANTNSDGANPYAGLVLGGNTLYGTTFYGGTNGYGTVFAVGTNGTGFTTIHTFGAFTHTNSFGTPTNSDGDNPFAGLTLAGGTLYGVALFGGTNGSGTVFSLDTNGMNFKVLHVFASFTTNSFGLDTNSDGEAPEGSLILAGHTLYGTTPEGGTNGNGNVFSITTNGADFAILYNFPATYTNTVGYSTNRDGANTSVGLTLSANTLYGTATQGGLNGVGTLFSLAYPSPSLAILHSGTNANVSWPGSVAGFSYGSYNLESATNIVPPSGWSAVSTPPVLVNTNYVVTNTISSNQMFYRLSE